MTDSDANDTPTEKQVTISLAPESMVLMLCLTGLGSAIIARRNDTAHTIIDKFFRLSKRYPDAEYTRMMTDIRDVIRAAKQEIAPWDMLDGPPTPDKPNANQEHDEATSHDQPKS